MCYIWYFHVFPECWSYPHWVSLDKYPLPYKAVLDIFHRKMKFHMSYYIPYIPLYSYMSDGHYVVK